MKVFVGDVVGTVPSMALNKIFGAVAPTDMLVRLALMRSRIIEIQAEYHKVRVGLLNQYGAVLDESTDMFKFKTPEITQEYQREHEILVGGIVDIPESVELTHADLEKFEHKLSADELLSVAWLIKEMKDEGLYQIPEQKEKDKDGE